MPSKKEMAKCLKSAALLARVAVAAVVIACATPAFSADVPTKITVITPPDRSVVHSAEIALALKLPANYVDELQVSVNGRRVKLPKKELKQYTTCYDGLSLSFGMNTIKIVGVKGGKKVEEVQEQVFFRSDLSSIAATPPAGFRKYLFHDYAYEKACAPCHELDFSKASRGESAPEDSPCYQCHKKLLSNYLTVHGPAAVWSCLSCHDPAGTPKLTVPKPEGKICEGCHENSWHSMKFEHGPSAAGDCATCHDPHASDHPYFLRTPRGEVCLGCHEEILTKPHVTAGFSGSGGHPVRKAMDPYHPGKDFSCVSCHNPHAGSSWTFLIGYDGKSAITTFCVTCHSM